MFQAPVRTVVLCFMFSCVVVHSAGAVPSYLSVSGESFIALETAVVNSFDSLVLEDLQRLDDTINSLNPLVSSCLSSINSSQSNCTVCINSLCTARAESLGCAEMVPHINSDPSNVIHEIGAVTDKVITAVKKVKHAVQHIRDKVTDAIENVAKDPIKTIGQGLQKTRQELKNAANKVVKGVKKTAGKVISGVQNVAKKVGETISKGVKKAVKTVFSAPRRIFRIRISRGWGRRRRRSSIEPTCDELSKNADACLFYESQCETCSGLGLGDSTEQSVEELVTGVCGPTMLDSYLKLDAASKSIDNILDVYGNVTLKAARYDPSVLENGNFKYVQFEFATVSKKYVVDVSTPINPYITTTAAPIIAKDIYDTLFPTGA